MTQRQVLSIFIIKIHSGFNSMTIKHHHREQLGHTLTQLKLKEWKAIAKGGEWQFNWQLLGLSGLQTIPFYEQHSRVFPYITLSLLKNKYLHLSFNSTEKRSVTNEISQPLWISTQAFPWYQCTQKYASVPWDKFSRYGRCQHWRVSYASNR